MATIDKQLQAAKEGLQTIIDCYERSTKRGRNCAYQMWRDARNYMGFLEELAQRDETHRQEADHDPR